MQPISDAQPAPRVIVVEEGLPTWFLLGVLALLAGILAALVAIARTLMQLRRRLAPASSEPSDAVERTARAGPVAERLASAHQE